MEKCFICRKHREELALPGGPILNDDLIFASHIFESPAGIPDSVYLGYVFVETKRHAPSFSDLTNHEAERVGRAAARVSEATKTALGAEHVFVAVIGTGIPHFHMHLVPRYPGTPGQLEWTRVDEWEGAPRGGQAAVEEATRRIRASLHW